MQLQCSERTSEGRPHLPPADETWVKTPEQPGRRCGTVFSFFVKWHESWLCSIAQIFFELCCMSLLEKLDICSLPLRVTHCGCGNWDRHQGSPICHPREQIPPSRAFWSKVLFCCLFFHCCLLFSCFFLKDYYKINNIPFLLAGKFRASSWAELLTLCKTLPICNISTPHIYSNLYPIPI